MYEEKTELTIGEETYNLVFTVAAMKMVNIKYGNIEKLIKMFAMAEIEEDDDAETKAAKEEQNADARARMYDELPWLITTLGDQGRWLKDPKAEPIDQNMIERLLNPGKLMMMAETIMKCINMGFRTENELNETRDPILEELDAKKAEGAAE